jgi:hypothetical protein
MDRAFVLWQSFLEPPLEELNSAVVNLRNCPMYGKTALGTLGEPILRQSFKTIEPVELAVSVEQEFRPVPRCFALKHPELQIQNFAIAYLFPDKIKQLLTSRKSPACVVPFRPHPATHFQIVD